jgi:nickel/cobalt transporter (NicO) family protein
MQQKKPYICLLSAHRLPFQNIGRILICALWVVAVFSPHSVKAHPADMYFQTCAIELSPEGVRMKWDISPGPMLTPSTWYETDLDNNNVISTDEAERWVEPLLAEFSLLLNDSLSLGIVLDSVAWPNSLTAMEIGDQVIEIHMHATFPEAITAQQQVIVSNKFKVGSSSHWFVLSGNDGVQFTQPGQNGNVLSFNLMPPEDGSLKNYNPNDLLTNWDSGVPDIDPAGNTSANGDSVYQDYNTNLIKVLRAADISPGLLLIGMLTSIFLGGLHALTPGHGKTIVAAYLVGTRGTIRHALFLGSIVTLTHTGSVIILGVITLVVSQYFLPTLFFPLLEIISGLLILGLGSWLLFLRARQWNAFRNRKTISSLVPAPFFPETDTEETEINSQTRISLNIPITEIGLPHQHPDIPDPSQVTWRSILTLGISGGLVPCPDAIAILLIAVAINRVLIGLSLITTFSLGMAVVLIIIGILMVQSQRLIVRFDTSQRITTLIPVASAMVVIILGAIITFTAIQRESFGQLISAMPAGRTSVGNFLVDTISSITPNSFTINTSKITYLQIDESEFVQLFITSIAESSTTAITDEPFGVWDYAISPDNNSLIYSTPRDDITNTIRVMDTYSLESKNLIECVDAACTAAQFSPDGTQVIYERLSYSPVGDNSPALTSLWWVDITTGETRPIFKSESLAGFNPRWSPDGQWFSYSAPGINTAKLYHLETGASISIPSRSGGIIDWSPDSKQVLVTDVRLHKEAYATHLMVYTIEDQSSIDLSENNSAQDTLAAWSPDGQWIAVVRRLNPDTQQDPGDNLWLMHPNGTNARPITSRVGAFHGRPVWAPDSAHLVYHVYTITQEGFQSGIWMMNIISQTESQVTDSGSRPEWLY